MIKRQPRTTLTWTPPRALLAAMLACLAFTGSAARAQGQVQVQPPSPEALGEAVAALRISQPGVRVSAVPSRQRSGPAELPFTRQQASDIGIDVMALLEPIDFLPPIWNGRGLSAGDVDRDGYPDVLVATKRGGVRTTDPEAYALFLQARFLRLQNNPEAYENAFQLYQQALSIDPDYPPALEGLAEMYVYQGLLGMRPVDEASRLAREAIDQALAIDPRFAVGVAGLGWIAILYDHNLAAAARHFEHALMLDPTDLDIIDGAAFLAEALGHLETAVAFKEYAVARDPAGPVGHFDLSLAYLKVGRPDDAATSVRTALTLHPEQFGAWALLGLTLLANGETQAALEAIEQETIDTFRLSGLAFAYYDLGQKDESDRMLAELIEKHADDASIEVAGVFAWRGDNDSAFAWLERARENKETALSNVASHYTFRTLHDDPRWQPFLAEVGQSDAQLAAIEFNVSLSKQESGK